MNTLLKITIIIFFLNKLLVSIHLNGHLSIKKKKWILKEKKRQKEAGKRTWFVIGSETASVSWRYYHSIYSYFNKPID
jgi:hypothetical protein